MCFVYIFLYMSFSDAELILLYPAGIVTQVFSTRSWAIIKSVYNAKAMWPLHVHYWWFEFVSVFIMVCHYILFYGTYVGKVVGKATRECFCCVANIDIGCLEMDM